MIKKLLVCLALCSSVALADGSGSDAIVLLDAGVGSGSAVAAPVVVPDPLAAPGDSISLLSKLYHGGLFFDLGILVAFFALTIAAKKWKWLQDDHRAVFVAAALGALTILSVPAAQGTTPNIQMILGALITAVGLAMNPKKPAADAEKKAAGS